jgi:hypothetical protein
MARTARHTRFARGLVALAAAATAVSISMAGSPPAQASTERISDAQVWYWSERLIADALYWNGIDWPSAGRHDRLRKNTCWGVGKPLSSSGISHYRYFWCEATTRQGQAYSVVVSVVARSQYSVKYAGLTKSPPEYWTSQLVANALVDNGVSWSNAYDRVSADYCAGFGRSFQRNGATYFKNFLCAVDSPNRQSYLAVVDVDASERYSVYWVDYNVGAQTSTPTPPAGPQRTEIDSSPRGTTVTIGGSYNVPSGNVGTTVTIGGAGLDPILSAANTACEKNPSVCGSLMSAINNVYSARANAARVWAMGTCMDPYSGRFYSC